MIRCDNCGMPFENQDKMALPLYCDGCEDYLNWKREESMTQSIEPVKSVGVQLDQQIHGKTPMTMHQYPNEQMILAPGIGLIKKKLIYLASVYSHRDDFMKLERFHAVCRTAAILMAQGHLIFSPIAHTHPIASIGGLSTGWDFWEKYDRAVLECCKELWVLDIPGWMESVGVLAEIKIAHELGIPVRLVSEDGVMLS